MTDRAAAELAAAFLVEDRGQRGNALAAILANEPPLLLWCLRRSSRWAQAPPASLADLAAWLAEHGLRVLQWEPREPPPLLADSPGQRAIWATWAAEAVVAARQVLRMDSLGSAATAFQALVARADQWLASCAPPSGTMPEVLPRVGAESGAQPAPSNLGLPSPAAAAPAVPSVAELPRCPATAQASEQETDTAVADRVRDRWLAPDDPAAASLPVLLRRLARLAQLETEFQQTLETEKLEALRMLAYGESHEINNPLANIANRAQTLLRDEQDPERRRKLALIVTHAFRAHEMISDLMLFARPPALHRTAVNVMALADQVLAELAAEAKDQGTVLRRSSPDVPVTASCDGGHLAVGLRAICRNALEALGSGGRVELCVRETAAPPDDPDGGRWCEIQVQDTGPGIPPPVRRHLFDPYFSGREAGRGLGLGLSKCWRIVTAHGGRIDVHSEPGRGTTFTVRLPCAQRCEPAAAVE